jgi:uncharacterized protein
MQFLLIAYDGKTPNALDRRLRVRPEHLERVNKLKKNGEFIFGGAILDDKGKMIGSAIVYDFPDRTTLDERLNEEPYVTEGVWQKIEIMPFQLANIE